MAMDPWHYPRTALAKQILDMFETGLSSALVFFAPRRMGKTEFLRKDISPAAEKRHWKVFYFSFLDVESTAAAEFCKSLTSFAEKIGLGRNLLEKVSKVSGEALGVKAGIEFTKSKNHNTNVKDIIAKLAEKNKILLLMDEVQVLAQNPKNASLIASLRTVLDIHKDNVKAIFTGSSQEGLRRMFSQAKAPFFHFGLNLPFPELDRGFTDHLVDIFKRVTKRALNTEELWLTFQEMQKIPQLARSLVERLALNPALKLREAKIQLLSEIFENRAFIEIWSQCSALEKLLLAEIIKGDPALFSIEARGQFTKTLGITQLSVSSIQSAMRTLQRKNLIGQSERGGYHIDDPNFKTWLLQQSIVLA